MSDDDEEMIASAVAVFEKFNESDSEDDVYTTKEMSDVLRYVDYLESVLEANGLVEEPSVMVSVPSVN